MDTTGPFKVGVDYDVKTKFRMKYMLVGAFTWLKPDGGTSDPRTKRRLMDMRKRETSRRKAIDTIFFRGEMVTHDTLDLERNFLRLFILENMVEIFLQKNVLVTLEKILGENFMVTVMKILGESFMVNVKNTLKERELERNDENLRSMSSGCAFRWRRRDLRKCYKLSTRCTSS